MDISLIVVPYDSGQRAFRMGRGPEHLLNSGLADQLRRSGHSVRSRVLETTGDAVTSAFDLAAQIAMCTRNAVADGAFPVVLAGNCISSVGALAGFDMRTSLLWLDAHADFNTPETSPSGFLDGMALAVITGRCYREQAGAIAGFTPLADERIVMLGVRSIDDGEQAALQDVAVARSSRELWRALARLDTIDLYLHVDLDALDPSVLKANSFATRRGLSLHTLHDAIAAAQATRRIVGLALTAYDPDADVEQHGPAIALDIIARVISSRA